LAALHANEMTRAFSPAGSTTSSKTRWASSFCCLLLRLPLTVSFSQSQASPTMFFLVVSRTSVGLPIMLSRMTLHRFASSLLTYTASASAAK
jgi:hypothetical protein